MSPRPCGSGLVVAGFTFWSPFVRAGRLWRGGEGCTDGRVVASSWWVVGWCGIVAPVLSGV